MTLELNKKTIMERCGAAAYNKGRAYHRTNKVEIVKQEAGRWEAVVHGTEEFHVIVEGTGGRITASCSCPSLASFRKDCQHIAALLLWISENENRFDETFSEGQDISNQWLSSFKKRRPRRTGKQNYFDKRQELAVIFACSPVLLQNGAIQLGIEINIGTEKIEHIRHFLERIRESEKVRIGSFTYDPDMHCFRTEDDEVLKQLVQLMGDEQVFLDREKEKASILIIPPSSVLKLLKYLEKAQFSLSYNDTYYREACISSDSLGLAFRLSENITGYILNISGLEKIYMLEASRLVLVKERMILLDDDDFRRIKELRHLCGKTGSNRVPIANKQLRFFIEKVVPGLKQLGEVTIEPGISEKLGQEPLKAKIYLDRIGSRLLVGVEFHYGHQIIQPLDENGGDRKRAVLFREQEKEEQILGLMDESGFAKTEGGYFLQNEALEYQFLHHQLPKLQPLASIYATTAVRNRIVKGGHPPRIKVRLKRERLNLLEFKFEMDGIPNDQIKDVLQALEDKRKYYRLRNGSLLSLETKEYEEIRRFLNEVPVQEDDNLHFSMPLLQGLPFIEKMREKGQMEAEASFKDFLESLLHPERNVHELPDGLEGILRDYQKHGYRWMKTLAEYGMGGILADDMGLGKTLQSICFLSSCIPEIRSGKLPALIICPSSLTYNWLREFHTFTPEIRAVIADGKQSDRSKVQEELDNVDILITSYPLLRKDIKWYEKQKFHTVIFDEAQAFKNPVTQTAKAVKKINAENRFALTGTPMENAIEELWSISTVVIPGLFGNLKEFSELSKAGIAKRIQPFMLRRMKEDILSELPGKQEHLEVVELLPEQKKLYAAYLAKLKEDTFKHLDKETLNKNKIRILAGLTRLRQICCHPALFVQGYQGTSGKYEQLKQILQEARLAGRRVLIFSQFTEMLSIIRNDLMEEDVPYFYLDGMTPSEERVELCARFNQGECDLFLISLKAGGTGLNLTGADTVILYDSWWNPAVEEQAADRAHRMGQKNIVQVVKLVTKGTLEEKINELQDRKKKLIEEVIGVEGTFTDDDIRELLSFSVE